LATIAFLTPLFTSLPNAALGAIIIMAVIGLVDIGQMRHIAHVKKSDLLALGIAFVATLSLGIEIGIGVAIVASMLIVFARMSMPHSAVLGHIDGTTSYRNVERFPEAETVDGIRLVRIDSELSFVNAASVKKLLVEHAEAVTDEPRALVLDASGINDLDVTGAEMLHELLVEVADRGVVLHLADVKGPVRDVLRRAGIWDELSGRIHTSTADAVAAITRRAPAPTDQRRHGIDERSPDDASAHDAPAHDGSTPPAPSHPAPSSTHSEPTHV
jgi:sulfate permease, SulP family